MYLPHPDDRNSSFDSISKIGKFHFRCRCGEERKKRGCLVIEKFDITEERVRLRNHLDYFKSSLDSSDSNGKKLGFISQEIGREINTIGSKANYAPMQKLVVQMKDELEKIKEQMLNVL